MCHRNVFHSMVECVCCLRHCRPIRGLAMLVNLSLVPLKKAPETLSKVLAHYGINEAIC